MKAIFPNSQSLQPIPNINSVHANVSGNINSTTTPAPSYTTNTQNPTSTTSVTPSINTTSSGGNNLFFYFTILIIIILIIIIYRKFKQR